MIKTVTLFGFEDSELDLGITCSTISRTTVKCDQTFLSTCSNCGRRKLMQFIGSGRWGTTCEFRGLAEMSLSRPGLLLWRSELITFEQTPNFQGARSDGTNYISDRECMGIQQLLRAIRKKPTVRQNGRKELYCGPEAAEANLALPPGRGDPLFCSWPFGDTKVTNKKNCPGRGGRPLALRKFAPEKPCSLDCHAATVNEYLYYRGAIFAGQGGIGRS